MAFDARAQQSPIAAETSRGRAAVAAAFFAQGFAFAVVITHLGAFKDRWELDDLAITVIMFVVAVLAGAGSALAATLAARFGSATALRLGLAGVVIGVTLAALAPVFPVLCAGLAVYGIALGCVDATSNMQAVACEALQGRSILTSFHGAWSAGGILGAVETSLTATAEWPLAASLAVAALIPAAAVAAPFLPAAAPTASAAAPTVSAAAPTASAAAPTTSPEPAPAPTTSLEEASAPVTTQDPPRAEAARKDRKSGKNPPAAPAIPWRTMTVLGAAIVLFYVADSATQSWSTIYLHDVLLASAGLAPLGYAAYQGTSLLSRLAGDHLVRRLGSAPVVRIAALIGAAGLALAVAAPAPWLAITGFAILGIGIAVVAPLTFATAGRLATVDPEGRPVTDPARRRAAADAIIARVNQFNYLGFVLGGVLTGLVASGSDMRIGFIVPLVGIAAILPLARAFDSARQ